MDRPAVEGAGNRGTVRDGVGVGVAVRHEPIGIPMEVG